MAKRFIDNSILPKGFRKLDPRLKLTWYYLWLNCDESGVYDIDEDLFEFENGFSLDLSALKELFKGIVDVNEGKILIKDFIFINQCDFSKLKPDYNPHKPVFRAISKNKLKLEPSLNQASFKLVVEVVEEEKVEVVEEVILKKSEKTFTQEVDNCYEQVLPLFPESLRPRTDSIVFSWKDCIEKLNRIDKIPFNYIVHLTKEAREDSFWKGVFLSLPKLRSKNKDKIKYIQVFHEQFKPKQDQQADRIIKNMQGWD